MNQLVTIFEKIKEDFFKDQKKGSEKGEYDLVFSPFSIGFTYDDFLFLDTNSASEDANKYVDELLEFSQIANTIPKGKNFWAISDQQDYLYHPYQNIVDTLKLIDMESLDIKMCYKHPIFSQALLSLGDKSRNYRGFFDQWIALSKEIDDFSANLKKNKKKEFPFFTAKKKNELGLLERKWEREKDKTEIEAKVLEILRDEFKRFLGKLSKVKGQLATSIRSHPGSGMDFYLTSCMPNNLFKGEDLSWKKVALDKKEVQSLLSKIKTEDYSEIVDSDSELDLEIQSIQFELLFVNTTRAWFDESLLDSPFWDINILNKETISIPKVISKLIFIRNLEIKAPKLSEQTKKLIAKKMKGSVGPFAINTSIMGKDGTFKLHSKNKGFKLDKTTISKTLADLEKNRTNDTKPLRNRDNRQLESLADRLKNIKEKKPPRQRSAKSRTQTRAGGGTWDRNSPPARMQRSNPLEKEEDFDSFQLIGVVSKEMPSFPNPIEDADYI